MFQKRYWRSTLLFVIVLVQGIPSYAQQMSVEAGPHQIINWEQTHTAQLSGRISPANIPVRWTCPHNADVIFKDPSKPHTEVKFPRPGYYLLVLSTRATKNNVSDSLVCNVFQAGTYKERVRDLLRLMTVDEKIAQLTNQTDAIPRLGIPSYNYWNEALHGVLAAGTTSFPQAIALGATWDPTLVHRVATAISDEARVLAVTRGTGLTYWSPTINIARDPRWGRNEESYSEDPFLLSQMAVAFVKGMQGNDPYYLKTVATPKHFIANNEEERRHTGSSDVDMRSLFEYYVPAFKAAIRDGKAYSIMGAYNEINHVPCNANGFLLEDLLRKRWGFEGYVVSDCGAINDMIYGHKRFATGAEAAAASLRAGCDLDCGTEYREYLKEALQKGLLDENDIDKALERVLSARFRLGEFDSPAVVPYTAISPEKLDCQEHRELALEAARKGIVLLKNDGILPLQTKKIKSIAMIGPNAAVAQLGIYSGFPNVAISPLEGISKEASASQIRVEYSKGCDIGGGLLRPIESKYFAIVEGTTQQGMRGEYFANMTLSGSPSLIRVDSMVDFTFGMNAPAPQIPADKFSVRWTGKIIPPDTIYHLGTSCDDGSRLYLDGKLIIDDWIEHGEKPLSAEVKLLPGKEYNIVFEYFENSLGACARLTWDLGQKDFEEAKRVAAQNDIVVLVLGISPGIAQEELDRKTIELPEVQRELIRHIASVNPNIVAVLINGGPLALAGAERYVRALVEAWYPGQMGGTAIADVLFGNYNPGGKLPQTFYASTQQLPPMWNYDIINHPRTYLYFDQPVLFPFGHGLSYTTFKYTNLRVKTSSVNSRKSIDVECTVQNVGERVGDEVVQVYVHYRNATFKVPRKQLKGFQRVTLQPGATQTVHCTIPLEEFSFYSTRTNDFEIGKGLWLVEVGSSSEDIRLKTEINIE